MIQHAPPDYVCPFCRLLAGADTERENLYAIPRDALATVSWTAALVARAMRESYGCDGTSTRQHNEPGAGQDVWHFHVHVFPRFEGDDLYSVDAGVRWTTAEERAPYAAKLAAALGNAPPGP